MGGYGSGRWTRYGTRPTTGERVRLDIDELRRQGLDLADVGPGDRARVELTAAGARWTWRPRSPRALPDGPEHAARVVDVRLDDDGPALTVPLSWARVGYGWRPFWRCPACARRARILYAAPRQIIGAAPRWTCRTCAGLAYQSTRLDDVERLTVRARRAAAAAGVRNAWRLSRLDLGAAMPPWRPCGMHRRTYARRLAAWCEARDAMDAALMAELGRGWPSSFVGRGPAASLRRARGAMLAEARAVYGRRVGR